MKLLLTSIGLTTEKIRKEFIRLLDKSPEKSKLLILVSKNIHHYLKSSIEDFEKAGIRKENIKIINITKIRKINKIPKTDILLVYGGNTFHILDRIKKTGFFKLINNYVKSGKFYMGLSAGSMITHYTIELAGWDPSGDKNQFKMKDLSGFGFTKIAVYPHYKNKDKKEIKIFRKIVNYPIVTLTDKQALLILGNKLRKI